MANKFHARKVTIDGIEFDSKRESEYYSHFVDMANAGIVSKGVGVSLDSDTDYMFWDSVIFKPDFRITYADGTIEVIEVKSKRTAKEPDYIIRRKLFKHNNPDVRFLEVF